MSVAPTDCRHCGTPEAFPRRGLCQFCYRRLPIRERYQREDKYAPKSADTMAQSKPPTPTDTPRVEVVAPEGGGPLVVRLTAARLAVLQGRAERGESVKHPGDATT